MTLTVRDAALLGYMDRDGNGTIDPKELHDFVDGRVIGRADGRIDRYERIFFEGLADFMDQDAATQITQMLRQIESGKKGVRPYTFANSLPQVLATPLLKPGSLHIEVDNLSLVEFHIDSETNRIYYTFQGANNGRIVFEHRVGGETDELFVTITSQQGLVGAHRAVTDQKEAAYLATKLMSAAERSGEFIIEQRELGKGAHPIARPIWSSLLRALSNIADK